ncbi:MAG: ABC transporter substrate-binding protein [Rhodocyclaceae bacterium]|jgi:phospholipid transport system substrate-binding protein|nr:ABC transporter substrate-binding protein [Rhodocyclaceae bacterium]
MRNIIFMCLVAFAGWASAAPQAPPDIQLRTATSAMTTGIMQNKNLQENSMEKIVELAESTILPMFNFRHMTRLAMARSWRIASPAQQDALVIEFRTLLVRTYSATLTSYRDQTIEYKTLRMAPDEITVTVKSVLKQPGTANMSIDYDMEKTALGWKVYDIKISDISLITTYRLPFEQAIREGGVDGLIKSLATKNLRADSWLKSRESGAGSFLFVYSVISGLSGSRR